MSLVIAWFASTMGFCICRNLPIARQKCCVRSSTVINRSYQRLSSWRVANHLNGMSALERGAVTLLGNYGNGVLPVSEIDVIAPHF